VPDGNGPEAEAVVEEQIGELGEAAGGKPALEKPDGHARKAIVETARDSGASLIVAGRRGAKGLKALGSVSERVVSDADCSVMLIPVG
jgi:nucleotide-binding universal stress UspA family protein